MNSYENADTGTEFRVRSEDVITIETHKHGGTLLGMRNGTHYRVAEDIDAVENGLGL